MVKKLWLLLNAVELGQSEFIQIDTISQVHRQAQGTNVLVSFLFSVQDQSGFKNQTGLREMICLKI